MVRKSDYERLKAAAEEMLKRYIALVESGDAGTWDPYGEPEVVALRNALADGADA